MTCVRYDSFVCICDMTYLYVSTTVGCLIHGSFIYVTWLVHMCDMTHSWLTRTCDMTHSWRILMCDMTYSYLWHDSPMTHVYVETPQVPMQGVRESTCVCERERDGETETVCEWDALVDSPFGSDKWFLFSDGCRSLFHSPESLLSSGLVSFAVISDSSVSWEGLFCLSDTPLIEHLILPEFVSGPLSYRSRHRRVCDRKPSLRERLWTVCV